MSNLSQDSQDYLKAFEADRTPLGVREQIAVLEAEIESLNKRVWQAEHDLERCRVELELWQGRANAQLEQEEQNNGTNANTK